LLDRAKDYRMSYGNGITPAQSDYFDGIEMTYEAILRFFNRAADTFAQLDGECAALIAQAMRNLHDRAPADTYEALLLGWIYWYLQENIDCVRARTMGGIDVLYLDFYRRDLVSGRYTKEELRDLISYFMCEFHAFRVVYQQPLYLGGVNENGVCTVNELSFVVLDGSRFAAENPRIYID
jgi:pyruvate-formate lyase